MVLVAGAVLAATALAFLSVTGYSWELVRSIRPAAIVSRNGYQFTVPAREFLSPMIRNLVTSKGSSNEEPHASKLTLLEQGIPLAQRNALHAEIVELGQGRYSHWKDHLLFSTSDNTDPATNGRDYSIRTTLQLNLRFPVVLLLVALVVGYSCVAWPQSRKRQ